MVQRPEWKELVLAKTPQRGRGACNLHAARCRNLVTSTRCIEGVVSCDETARSIRLRWGVLQNCLNMPPPEDLQINDRPRQARCGSTSCLLQNFRLGHVRTILQERKLHSDDYISCPGPPWSASDSVLHWPIISPLQLQCTCLGALCILMMMMI